RVELPLLRARLYLVRLGLEPERARPLLAELRRRELRNAVVALEQARDSFLVKNDLAAGMAQLRQAGGEFSRSYLTAVPAPLRRSIGWQRQVRELTKSGWPGYRWLFDTLEAMEQNAAPADRHELRRLRLRLAQLL